MEENKGHAEAKWPPLCSSGGMESGMTVWGGSLYAFWYFHCCCSVVLFLFFLNSSGNYAKSELLQVPCQWQNILRWFCQPKRLGSCPAHQSVCLHSRAVPKAAPNKQLSATQASLVASSSHVLSPPYKWGLLEESHVFSLALNISVHQHL